VTQTEDIHAPEFEAADRGPQEDLGWFRHLLAKYQNGLSTARASLLWVLLRRQKRTLKWLFFVLIVYSVGLFNTLTLTRGMVDNGIVDQTAPLWPYVRYLAFWGLWSMVFGFIQQQLAERLSYQIEFDLRVWLYTHIQSAELRRLDAVANGQLVTRSLTDVALVETLLRLFPTLVGFMPILIAAGVIVTIISPIMGVLTLFALPLNMVLLLRFRRPLRALSWAELNERAEVTSAVDEPVRGIRVVKAFGREAKERARVAAVTERAYKFSMSRARLLAHYDVFLKMSPILVQAALLAVGTWMLAAGRITAGTFLLAFQLATGFNQFAGALNDLANAWQYLRSGQDRLAEMLALSTRPVTDGRMMPLPSTGFELHDVEVTYGDRRFLHGLDLHVRPGELVVVNGPPGSGKTTLAGIASGLVEPDSGAVVLDGIALPDLDPTQLRRTIRVVSEEPLLLATSLRDNLLLGAYGEIDDAQLLDALHHAGADEVIAEMDGGLDGQVGDRGLTVSGGQRQRISLARALVAHPRVLILDDALSAVNPALEIEIMRRVRSHLPDTSILYITRRTGLMAIADRVVTLDPPATSTPPFVAVARDHLLDGTDEIVASQVAEVVHGADAVDSLEAIDLVGMEAEIADGARPLQDTSGLAAIDPVLAKLVDALDVSREQLDIPDELANNDHRPTFWSLARPFRRVAFTALGLAAMVALGQISPSLAFGSVTNFAARGDTRTAYLSAVLLAVIGVIAGLCAMPYRLYGQRFNQSMVCLLRRRVFYRLSKLGVNFYDRELPGDVATRVVADLDKILSFVQAAAFQFVSFVAIFVIAIIMIMILAPAVIPLVLAVLGIMLLLTLIELPIAARGFAWSRQELGVVTRKFQEDFGARHEIRYLGAHAIQTQKFVHASWDRRRARWWTVTVVNLHGAVLQFLGAMVSALVLYRTGTLVLNQEASIGIALSVQLLAILATQPLQALAPLYNQFLDVRVSWRRLCEPFDEPILPDEAEDARPCPPLDGPVTFDHVAFTYPQTARTVLRDVSFTMEPGKVTALVGYTGAGKSSIAKVLARTYDPDAGSVTVNGLDLRELTLDSYRAKLGIVPQDPFVFKGTIASNVRYSKPNATDAEVEGAVRAVGAWNLLATLPGGFGYQVEEEGHNLTAAQRQLVALARAWLAAPDILVLDEATSLLDTGVEDVIIEAVHNLGCTTLMITHRESVAMKSDNIVVLESGRVVDSGPEAQVARPGGPYDRLWRVQDDEAAAARDQELTV
jgi:ATP-binding cassette subfamily B protein